MHTTLSSEYNFPTQLVLVSVFRGISWLDISSGRPFAFPFYVLLNTRDWWKKSWLLSNLTDKGSSVVLASLQGRIPFVQTLVALNSEKNFPTHPVLVWVTRAILWLDCLPGNLLRFPKYGNIKSQRLMKSSWLLSISLWLLCSVCNNKWVKSWLYNSAMELISLELLFRLC